MPETYATKSETYSDFEVDGVKLSSIIEYCDGKIFWKISPVKWIPIGAEVGNVGVDGYRRAEIFGKKVSGTQVDICSTPRYNARSS